MVFSLLPEPTGNEGKGEARFVVDICHNSRNGLPVGHLQSFCSNVVPFVVVVVVFRSTNIDSKRGLLRWAALFLGELRDGLTMINMQSAFLIVSKNYTEKQAGVLFFGTWLFHAGKSK